MTQAAEENLAFDEGLGMDVLTALSAPDGRSWQRISALHQIG